MDIYTYSDLRHLLRLPTTRSGESGYRSGKGRAAVPMQATHAPPDRRLQPPRRSHSYAAGELVYTPRYRPLSQQVPGPLYSSYDDYVYPGQAQTTSATLPLAYVYQGATTVLPENVWPQQDPRREKSSHKLSRAPQRSNSARVVPVTASQEFPVRGEITSAPENTTDAPYEAWNLMHFATEASKRRGVPDDFPIYSIESSFPVDVEVAGKKKGLLKRVLSSLSFRNKISI
ncbi:uncharacterized protein LOC144913808 isoform X1 [Branchiostoma floridae x Branchiostoma belcheri]